MKESTQGFPPEDTSVIASFLCCIATASGRPKSVLSSTIAALTCFYEAMDMDPPSRSPLITKLLTALIKSESRLPRTKTPVMPIEPFSNLFIRWDGNSQLSLKDLRLKCITLMALAFMLRPSDIAPRASLFDQLEVHNYAFTTENLQFHSDGYLSVTFHGIKNDYHRDGFTIRLPPASNPQLDIGAALQCYLDRTATQRLASKSSAVFLSLKQPFKGLSSTAIASILHDAIVLAGLGGKGFTAKSFRPTAATQAVAVGCDSNVARQIGRWKSLSVFEEHYVHTIVPKNYVDSILLT